MAPTNDKLFIVRRHASRNHRSPPLTGYIGFDTCKTSSFVELVVRTCIADLREERVRIRQYTRLEPDDMHADIC